MAGEGWPYISVGWAEGWCGEEFVVESTLEKLGSLEPLIEKAICKSLTSNFKGAQRLSSANIWKLTHQLRAEGMACFPSPSPLLLPHSLRGIIHWCFHKGFPQGKPVSVTQYIYIKSQNLQQWNSKTLLSLGIFLQWKPDLFFSDLIHCLWAVTLVIILRWGSSYLDWMKTWRPLIKEERNQRKDTLDTQSPCCHWPAGARVCLSHYSTQNFVQRDGQGMKWDLDELGSCALSFRTSPSVFWSFSLLFPKWGS